MNLDDLLDHSATPVTPRTDELCDELDLLAARAETAAGATRKRLRVAIAGTTTAGLIAVAGAAAATGVLSDVRLPWTTDSGSTCRIDFDVMMHDELNGEPMKPRTAAMSDTEKMAVVHEAEGFLAGFDYGSIDEDRAVRTWEREFEKANGEPPEEVMPDLTAEDREISAVGNVVVARLLAHLKEKGLNSDAILFSQGSRCAP
jgi:hypothetical protein